MADDNTIIEGTVKFRDGKKWKARWCVMRRLSPVADCVHVQVWRDARARRAGAQCKASLSLQQFVGSEAGFTLDKHSNTLALVCRDLVLVLAFDTRERLMQWQVKVCAQLGEARTHVVLVAAGGRLAAGPARLHVRARRVALTAGVPPRLLALWDLPHLRRYGVVDGRFCFEGGSHCGKGEGLHVLISDRPADIARDFDLASRGLLSPTRRYTHSRNVEGARCPSAAPADAGACDPSTLDRSLPPADLTSLEEPGVEDSGAVSPYWPSAEGTGFNEMGLGDTASVSELAPAEWRSAAALERCVSCMSKLGALSRSSTAALTPGAKHFSPAWTMEPLHEMQRGAIIPPASAPAPCPPPERPPDRPPKPTSLELRPDQNRLASPTLFCGCDNSFCRIGPYENYDVPKLPSADVSHLNIQLTVYDLLGAHSNGLTLFRQVEGEYYDTPKRLKDCLNNEIFKITKSSTSDGLILEKPCGCLLKFGKRRKEPTIVEAEEDLQPTSCPCQRVTDWANTWMRLPYCRKNTVSSDNLVPNKENVTPNDWGALYATVDLSRKTRRKLRPSDRDGDIKGVEWKSREGGTAASAHYENLHFALSLEYYENAKVLLRKAGVTQVELDEISAKLKLVTSHARPGGEGTSCTKCGHALTPRGRALGGSTNEDYLMMEPNAIERSEAEQAHRSPAGYAPMSPIGSFTFLTLKHPTKSPINRLLEEKSASNPALCVPEGVRHTELLNGAAPSPASRRSGTPRGGESRQRSSSADSSRFLEDVKEFEGSVGSCGSTSSLETLRNTAPECARTRPPCECVANTKHSDVDSSEASKGRAPVPEAGGANRDSSSSNDSGVSSWSLRRGVSAPEHELPRTTHAARRHFRSARRAAAAPPAARRSRSTDPLGDGATARSVHTQHKSSSAEAEVPVLSTKPLRGVADSRSTSSGASDMSDYIETLSVCSSHSSSDTPITMRVVRQTSTLRPRSGSEYQNLAPRLPPALRARRS